jgi:hypothetical protein
MKSSVSGGTIWHPLITRDCQNITGDLRLFDSVDHATP